MQSTQWGARDCALHCNWTFSLTKTNIRHRRHHHRRRQYCDLSIEGARESYKQFNRFRGEAEAVAQRRWWWRAPKRQQTNTPQSLSLAQLHLVASFFQFSTINDFSNGWNFSHSIFSKFIWYNIFFHLLWLSRTRPWSFKPHRLFWAT